MISLHTHNLPKGSRWTCVACKSDRRAILCSVAYAAWVIGAMLLAFYLTGCGCPTAYRFDGGPVGARNYYKVEMCQGKPQRVLCDSPDPLPNAECE